MELVRPPEVQAVFEHDGKSLMRVMDELTHGVDDKTRLVCLYLLFVRIYT
jgi:hypothetical protein